MHNKKPSLPCIYLNHRKCRKRGRMIMRVKIERISLTLIIHASEIMSCTALTVLLAFERLDAVGLRGVEQFVSVPLELHE